MESLPDHCSHQSASATLSAMPPPPMCARAERVAMDGCVDARPHQELPAAAGGAGGAAPPADTSLCQMRIVPSSEPEA